MSSDVIASIRQGGDDDLVMVGTVLNRSGDFAEFLVGAADVAATIRLERVRTIGRPVRSPEWFAGLEAMLGGTVVPGKRDPKPSANAATVARYFSKLSP